MNSGFFHFRSLKKNLHNTPVSYSCQESQAAVKTLLKGSVWSHAVPWLHQYLKWHNLQSEKLTWCISCMAIKRTVSAGVKGLLLGFLFVIWLFSPTAFPCKSRTIHKLCLKILSLSWERPPLWCFCISAEEPIPIKEAAETGSILPSIWGNQSWTTFTSCFMLYLQEIVQYNSSTLH